MDKTQEEKFEEWYDRDRHFLNKEVMKSVWEACLEANGIGEDYSNPPNKPCGHESDKPCDCELNREEPRIPDGYFKIGEKIECKTRIHDWQEGVVVATCKSLQTELPEHVRRIPAWVPKDGEAVLYHHPKGISVAGVYSDGRVYYDETYGAASKEDMRPFNASKIGKPWSEIV